MSCHPSPASSIAPGSLRGSGPKRQATVSVDRRKMQGWRSQRQETSMRKTTALGLAILALATDVSAAPNDAARAEVVRALEAAR